MKNTKRQKLTVRKTAWYGWKPELPDARDLPLQYTATRRLPKTVDLRVLDMPPVYNQSTLGSCTANAIAAAYDYELHKQTDTFLGPSRLFIYYNERVMEGTTYDDSGAMIRDGMKSIAKVGVCPESLWPYKMSEFAVKPPPNAYTAAQAHQALVYKRVAPLGMRSCLAHGWPIVMGFTVYESFDSDDTARTGLVAMPKPNEQVVGGHAILVVGYDDGLKHFVVRNSWGDDWGDKGYCYMPYDYLMNTNLADDRWMLTQVEG